MSRLLPAIATLTEVFNDYAGKDGVKDSLTKAELTELLKKEMYMEGGKQSEVDKFFDALDRDGSGLVNFQEYISFVASFAMIINDM
ncbi:putative ictacalcin-like isoform 2 [Scophthalmus maximus]|nr:protein S100-A6 [Scophthalmus maximus]AWO96566.1 putative ictacalcin-like isoform 2 [Scophthalmus maximus]KAF0045430.1 hypothetical protein F2P81_001959 [Scophthalmus maximus]